MKIHRDSLKAFFALLHPKVSKGERVLVYALDEQGKIADEKEVLDFLPALTKVTDQFLQKYRNAARIYHDVLDHLPNYVQANGFEVYSSKRTVDLSLVYLRVGQYFRMSELLALRVVSSQDGVLELEQIRFFDKFLWQAKYKFSAEYVAEKVQSGEWAPITSAEFFAEAGDSYSEKMEKRVRLAKAKAKALRLIYLYAQNSASPEAEFVSKMVSEIASRVRYNKITVESLAKNYGIADQTKVKELTELAIVNQARKLVDKFRPDSQRTFDAIVDLYANQVNLSHRTSQSILLQQYSTPAPLGYLAGLYVGIDTPGHYFEPSAGNGLLTVAGNPAHFTVNEIDEQRLTNLKTQGFAAVLQQDATEPFKGFDRQFDGLITNPPFGSLDDAVTFDGFAIKALDHVMAIRGLECLKDSGRAAIIIGGHNQYDSKGRIQAGKNRMFLNYLYSHYLVDDVINMDGHKLYSRQGTAFDTRMILIAGRKVADSKAAPLYDHTRQRKETDFSHLFQRITSFIPVKKANKHLSGPYRPESDACNVLDTIVPDSMDVETHRAIGKIRENVGGDIDEFVRVKLGYRTKAELCKALAAEQVDAVAMAIYNIEKGKATIIGDQTGIGKGREAAGIIRYACHQGKKPPIFITEKANLFSDLYRDLNAIGSGHLVPFIINAQESKTDIKDENGKVLYKASPPAEQKGIFEAKKLPKRFDFILSTYTQYNSGEKKPLKPDFLLEMAENNIIIMDESHNASGSSNTGEFLQKVIFRCQGAAFLSATFAKRPDNMPIYALKTAISDANMSPHALVTAITEGGVALQEILASQLVKEGQMIRRERSFEGVEVNYITLEAQEQEHRATADNITSVLRDIISFQTEFVDPVIQDRDSVLAAEGMEIKERGGTSEAGLSNSPAFSKIFQVIYQMLFSIKASSVADRAIMRLREGKKPVIAFTSTMGSFLETMLKPDGMPVGPDDTINADYSEVLLRGLDGVMRYTEKDHKGKKKYGMLTIDDLSFEGAVMYEQIRKKIKGFSAGISISPIDVIIQKIEDAGYSVAEVTGRKLCLRINPDTNVAIVKARKKENTNDAFRRFNDNQVDCLMINQSGSTGASAHAVTTNKVSADQVKQRVMIVLQAELNINTEVQKRGRVNRTGQLLKAIYDYVNSAIPAEKRLMMMTQKKLKSLDANTTSNQKQSTKILDTEDFLNKYGAKVVEEYLKEHKDINAILGDPLNFNDPDKPKPDPEDAANKVAGRVAILATKDQEAFYSEISARYAELVAYLKQTGQYDLEVENLNLQAETRDRQVVVVGKGGESAFGRNSILETVQANVLRKPFTKVELDNLIVSALDGKTATEVKQETVADFKRFVQDRLQTELAENSEYYAKAIADVDKNKKYKKIKDDAQRREAVSEAKAKLREAKELEAQRTETFYKNRLRNGLTAFEFFHVGRAVLFPTQNFSGEKGEAQKAVFVGFQFDKKRSNPYAPSAYRLKFAIASGDKFLAIAGSAYAQINDIIVQSNTLLKWEQSEIIDDWTEITKKSSADRHTRYIVTGNVLQAFKQFRGKLVSYTTMKGGIKKGILLPESYEWDKAKDTVQVGVKLIAQLIRGMTNGKSVGLSDGIVIGKTYYDYKIYVPASRQKGGRFFLSPVILALVKGKSFKKVSGTMAAEVESYNLDALLEVLDTTFGINAKLKADQLSLIGDISSEEYEDEEEMPLLIRQKPKPLAPEQDQTLRIRIAKAKAKALKLKYQYAEAQSKQVAGIGRAPRSLHSKITYAR